MFLFFKSVIAMYVYVIDIFVVFFFRGLTTSNRWLSLTTDWIKFSVFLPTVVQVVDRIFKSKID